MDSNRFFGLATKLTCERKRSAQSVGVCVEKMAHLLYTGDSEAARRVVEAEALEVKSTLEFEQCIIALYNSYVFDEAAVEQLKLLQEAREIYDSRYFQLLELHTQLTLGCDLVFYLDRLDRVFARVQDMFELTALKSGLATAKKLRGRSAFPRERLRATEALLRTKPPIMANTARRSSVHVSEKLRHSSISGKSVATPPVQSRGAR